MAIIKSVRGFTPAIGRDCFLADNACVIGDVVIGNGCSIWFSTVLRGDVNSIRIGDGTNIQDGTVIHTLYQRSTTVIGNNVSVGHNVTIHGADIRDNALIGMGSVVLSKTVIPPHTLWAGVPAKYVKDVDPAQAEEMNQRIARDYHMYAGWYKEE